MLFMAAIIPAPTIIATVLLPWAIFNTDAIVQELLRQGKSIEDARNGGASGCVESGAFGKEAYILTGYFNLTKMLELALHDGVDLRTGKQLGPRTGSPDSFASFDDLFRAFASQLRHFVDVKIAGNQIIDAQQQGINVAGSGNQIIDNVVTGNNVAGEPGIDVAGSQFADFARSRAGQQLEPDHVRYLPMDGISRTF